MLEIFIYTVQQKVFRIESSFHYGDKFFTSNFLKTNFQSAMAKLDFVVRRNSNFHINCLQFLGCCKSHQEFRSAMHSIDKYFVRSMPASRMRMKSDDIASSVFAAVMLKFAQLDWKQSFRELWLLSSTDNWNNFRLIDKSANDFQSSNVVAKNITNLLNLFRSPRLSAFTSFRSSTDLKNVFLSCKIIEFSVFSFLLFSTESAKAVEIQKLYIFPYIKLHAKSIPAMNVNKITYCKIGGRSTEELCIH